jgi:hypothetical protein
MLDCGAQDFADLAGGTYEAQASMVVEVGQRLLKRLREHWCQLPQSY